jgi:cupin fold WbuC family metalloprotein
MKCAESNPGRRKEALRMTAALTVEFLDTLRGDSVQSPRRRQHFNLHRSFADPCQRFLNAMNSDSYIRPHRHSLDLKDELLVAVSGALALCTFDEEGALSQITPFATEAYWRAGMSFAVAVSPGTWHTVVALTDQAVLLEVKAGPFNPDAAKEPAPWAPAEGVDDLAKPYLRSLQSAAAQLFEREA